MANCGKYTQTADATYTGEQRKTSMDHYLLEERELKADYADGWLAQNVEEAHIKHQRDEELEAARKSMVNVMTAIRKEATKIDGQYDDDEEQEAKKETGEEAAIIMPNSIRNVAVARNCRKDCEHSFDCRRRYKNSAERKKKKRKLW